MKFTGNLSEAKAYYKAMLTSRIVDELEESLIGKGEAFFSVSGAGHEASVLLNAHLIAEDWLYLHYRDKALMMARGLKPLDFFLGLLCRDTSHSRGRQMSAHLSSRELNIVSLAAPMGNNALHSCGTAHTIKDQPEMPIVVHSMGDGTTQQGEVLEALAEAARSSLPVLFLIHDNELAISTTTKGKTFFKLPNDEEPKEFIGIPIHHTDGWDAGAAAKTMKEAVEYVREQRKPLIVVMKCKRLCDHTNADNQEVYIEPEDLETFRTKYDPIINMRAELLERGLDEAKLAAEEDQLRAKIALEAEQALDATEPETMYDAARPLLPRLTDPAQEFTGTMQDEGSGLTMLESIREVLRYRLQTDERVLLYGEDIQDPKGDVFGITRTLTKEAPTRVINSPLTESTVIGVAIGRALAGERPVAFLQFADFYPPAFNQIISELATYWWRTDGQWECPVIVMITCGGYRPGLGPFHAQTMESISAHIPGVDVLMPSTAGDAAALLNSAFESGRPTLFFYPKNLLNDRARTTDGIVKNHLAALGKATIRQEGDHLTIVGWGNTVPTAEKVADLLAQSGKTAEVIDLRSLMPWDEKTVVESVRKTGHLLVIHEDNKTCGFGAEVLATVMEHLPGEPIKARRVVRADTHIPCHFPSQLEILPSVKRATEVACELLGLKIDWQATTVKSAEGVMDLVAFGSSPSDERITLLEWAKKVGDDVKEGELLVDVEADKAVFEYPAPATGKLIAIHSGNGESVPVGTVVGQIATDAKVRAKAITREIVPPAVITVSEAAIQPKLSTNQKITVYLNNVVSIPGSRIVCNEEAGKAAGVDSEFISSRTGIESRFWIAGEESTITLGRDALQKLLKAEGLCMDDIDLVICCTGTAPYATPSLACMILGALDEPDTTNTHAYDISAACSGYVFGLQQAHDFLNQQPTGRVVVLTSEVLSNRLEPSDPTTSIIFGDAATATLVTASAGKKPGKGQRFQLHRPLCGTDPDRNLDLVVPAAIGNDKITMEGKSVFAHGVRRMSAVAKKACEASNLTPADVKTFIPHQANQRILDAVAKRMGVGNEVVYSNIARFGNTSSSTIPICLSELLEANNLPGVTLLSAFGGGFTWGGAVIVNEEG
ncbi:MAG: beta-ketoacyl-ACP synthase 3 [Sumerlaeia bacterium]